MKIKNTLSKTGSGGKVRSLSKSQNSSTFNGGVQSEVLRTLTANSLEPTQGLKKKFEIVNNFNSIAGTTFKRSEYSLHYQKEQKCKRNFNKIVSVFIITNLSLWAYIIYIFGY